MVTWYWSADTLFWQVSIDHNMDVQYQRSTQYSIAQRSLSRSAWWGMGRKLIQRLGANSLCPCVLGHEFPARGWVWRAVPPFPPSRWKTERLNEKTRDPVFIVVLGCEKHVQLLICIYLAVLCDIMLRPSLSSIVNSHFIVSLGVGSVWEGWGWG